MGETVYVILVRKEGREGQVIVSKRKADEKIFWKDLRIAFDEHKPVQGTIAHKIKGGYEVDLGNDIRAFLPAVQGGREAAQRELRLRRA